MPARHAGNAVISSAGDIYNGNNFIAHFGLGDATNVEVLRIEWPSGVR